MEEAFSKLKKIIDIINTDLEKFEVDASDIFVSNFRNGHNYWSSSAFFKSDDYRASTNVTITNLKVEAVEAVLLVLGSNEIKDILQVSYALKSDTQYKTQARTMALESARGKAKEMAGTMGVQVGSALVIEELPERVPQSPFAVSASRRYLAMEEQSPYNASVAIDGGGVSSFYPQKIVISQHVRVIFHMPQ